MPDTNDTTPPQVELEQLRMALDAAVDVHLQLADELAEQDAMLIKMDAALRELMRLCFLREQDAAALEAALGQAADALLNLDTWRPHK